MRVCSGPRYLGQWGGCGELRLERADRRRLRVGVENARDGLIVRCSRLAEDVRGDDLAFVLADMRQRPDAVDVADRRSSPSRRAAVACTPRASSMPSRCRTSPSASPSGAASWASTRSAASTRAPRRQGDPWPGRARPRPVAPPELSQLSLRKTDLERPNSGPRLFCNFSSGHLLSYGYVAHRATVAAGRVGRQPSRTGRNAGVGRWTNWLLTRRYRDDPQVSRRRPFAGAGKAWPPKAGANRTAMLLLETERRGHFLLRRTSFRIGPWSRSGTAPTTSAS